MSMGLIYQQSEINNLNNETDSAKEKLRKTAQLLLNITNLEYNNLDSKIQETIKIQKDLIIESEISVYAESIFLILNNIFE